MSGLRPGSTLIVSSKNHGDTTIPIDGDGTIDGQFGFINGPRQPDVLTVTAVTADGTTLTGTFAI